MPLQGKDASDQASNYGPTSCLQHKVVESCVTLQIKGSHASLHCIVWTSLLTGVHACTRKRWTAVSHHGAPTCYEARTCKPASENAQTVPLAGSWTVRFVQSDSAKTQDAVTQLQVRLGVVYFYGSTPSRAASGLGAQLPVVLGLEFAMIRMV